VPSFFVFVFLPLLSPRVLFVLSEGGRERESTSVVTIVCEHEPSRQSETGEGQCPYSQRPLKEFMNLTEENKRGR
jgi:hypothetical protein